MKKNQFLLTGGTGWLGQRVAKAITSGLEGLEHRVSSGHSLRCLVPEGEDSSYLRSLGVEIVVGNVNDDTALAKFFLNSNGSFLIHLAGIIHPPGRAKYFDLVNFQGCENIIRASKSNGIQRAVVMSSNSPFGGNPGVDDLFDENSPYNPYMGYGKSKMKMERMLFDAIESGHQEIVIVRAPWFYGPGQPPRQTLFFQMVKDGKFPIIGSGLNKRSMAYVDSLALGILLASNVPAAKNQAFWIADQRPYSMNEIISTVKSVLVEDFGINVSSKQLKLPDLVSNTARFVDGALQECGLYNQKIHVLSEMNMTIACNIEKARRVLGYEPLVELREGMRNSIEWCLANNQKI